MSKFDYDAFTGDFPVAVSKERYTKQEAIDIAKRELGVDEVSVFDGYVYYGYGVDDNAPTTRAVNNWWLSVIGNCGNIPKRGCPVWAFCAKEV